VQPAGTDGYHQPVNRAVHTDDTTPVRGLNPRSPLVIMIY
jgi:hypothetical protein